MEASIRDIDIDMDDTEDDEIIEPDIIFDHILSNSINSTIENKIMSKVEKLLDEKDGKLYDITKKLEVDDNKFNKYNNENNIKIEEIKKELTDTAEGNIALSQIPKINNTALIGSDKEGFENMLKKKMDKKEIFLILILLIIIIFIIYIKFN